MAYLHARPAWRSHIVRHLAMRLSLGLVCAWFGVNQWLDPESWAHFVPGFMSAVSPLPDELLIRLHGSLLLVAAVTTLSGAYVREGALLAAFVLSQIIFALLVEHGEAGLIARDVGLLGLALALFADPTTVTLPLLLALFRRGPQEPLERERLERILDHAFRRDRAA
jgi:uncharacterized membrane protein YphA (DoxX/SURF4 family)